MQDWLLSPIPAMRHTKPTPKKGIEKRNDHYYQSTHDW